MDKAGMKLWIEEIWAKHTGALFKKPEMLVSDQFGIIPPREQ